MSSRLGVAGSSEAGKVGVVQCFVFDCFGVIVENGWGIIDDTLSPTEAQWEEMMAVSHAADRGIIPLDALIQRFAEILDADADHVRRIIARQRKDPGLLALIEQLSVDHKIMMLSNVSEGVIDQLLSPEDKRLFDDLILSSDVGMVKPQPAIFQLAIDRAGFAPEEIMFIDDSPLNVSAAQQLGLQTHHYTTLKDFRTTLQDV